MDVVVDDEENSEADEEEAEDATSKTRGAGFRPTVSTCLKVYLRLETKE